MNFLVNTYFQGSWVCPGYIGPPKCYPAFGNCRQTDGIHQTAHSKTHNHKKRCHISVSVKKKHYYIRLKSNTCSFSQKNKVSYTLWETKVLKSVPLVTKLYMEIWPFLNTWVPRVPRGSRPMLPCVTLCPLITEVQKQWKFRHLKG